MLISKEEFNAFVPCPPIPNAYQLTTLLYCRTRTQSKTHPCPKDCKVCGPFLGEVFYITVSTHPARTAEWRLKNLAENRLEVWINPKPDVLEQLDNYGMPVKTDPFKDLSSELNQYQNDQHQPVAPELEEDSSR